MDVPFHHLLFTLEPTRAATTPYALFELKQRFPAAFRKVTGCAPRGGPCLAGADCPCRSTFAQLLSADPSALRRYQKPPLPFAFRIPVLSCRDTEEYDLSLVIVGDATRHLELYLKSVQQLCGRNSALGVQLNAVAAVAADGSSQLLGSGSGRLDLSSTPLRTFAEAGSAPVNRDGSITLQLLAPLRLLHNGKPLRCPSFPLLAGALFRRVSALAYYYGGVELADDFKWLAVKSREINGSASQLEWANWGGALQGTIGKLSFSGELEEFMPFLRLGELLNVGKGAPYGMGSYLLAGS
ncbi:MAG: protein of unknown function, DUF2276-containing [Deltaproteobacteria bacterium]|nr:protein of unknown function, DUF2276-containing [Deltaproteobacteria bacterium]